MPLTRNMQKQGFPGGAVNRNLPANAGDTGSIPDSGRFYVPGAAGDPQMSFKGANGNVYASLQSLCIVFFNYTENFYMHLYFSKLYVLEHQNRWEGQ